MGLFYKALIRPVLFRFDAEKAHHLGASLLKWLSTHPSFSEKAAPVFSLNDARLETTLAGIPLSNPLGLAAGFDKAAEMLAAFRPLGFGFAEAGSFTPAPQTGNPAPRLLRLPDQEAILNSMGFNNPGADIAYERLRQTRLVFEKHPSLGFPLGVNIGKGRETPLEEASKDYLANFVRLYPVGDYFVLNVSSPNTPQLRRLERAEALSPILKMIQDKNRALAAEGKISPKPVFVKISPDLPEEELAKVCETLLSLGAGAVCTNTAHHEAPLPDGTMMSGGLSGKPIFEVSTRVIRTLSKLSKKRLPIIGVGGVSDAETAYAKIRAGAQALQLYTAWIYEGPGVVKNILKGLIEKLAMDGFKNISEAVGAE